MPIIRIQKQRGGHGPLSLGSQLIFPQNHQRLPFDRSEAQRLSHWTLNYNSQFTSTCERCYIFILP